MDYQKFLTEIEESLQTRLNGSFRICSRKVVKNNSIILDSLSIMQDGEKISPVIYLNGFYRKYQNGETLEDIADQILELYQEKKNGMEVDIDSFIQWEKARKRIVPRLINREKNRQLLEELPHRCFFDLAQIYTFHFEKCGDGDATVNIRNEHIQMWDISEEELHDAAFANMDILTPVSFSTLREIIQQAIPLRDGEEIPGQPAMFILSNRQSSYGAIWMCREDVLAGLPLKPSEDFYILPSSVHECILIPAGFSMEPEEMSDMVKEINETAVREEEVLGTSIYRFSRETGKVQKVAGSN